MHLLPYKNYMIIFDNGVSDAEFIEGLTHSLKRGHMNLLYEYNLMFIYMNCRFKDK